MSNQQVINSYGRAIFAELKQTNQIEQGLSELWALAKAIDDKEVYNFFSSPSVSRPARLELIEKVIKQLKMLPSVSQAVRILIENDRFSNIKQIIGQVQVLVDADQGITRGTLKCAVAPTQQILSEMEKNISRILNKKVSLSYVQDKNVIGGAIAQVGGWTFDDSVETHLKRMKEQLTR